VHAARARPLCCIRPTCWNAACNGTLQAGMVTAHEGAQQQTRQKVTRNTGRRLDAAVPLRYG